MEQVLILADVYFNDQFVPFLNLRHSNVASRRTNAEVHPMIHRRFPAIEVLCKLRVLECVVLERHPIIIPLLLSLVRRLIFLYFLCPVVRLFNDLKLHRRLGSTDAI